MITTPRNVDFKTDIALTLQDEVTNERAKPTKTGRSRSASKQRGTKLYHSAELGPLEDAHGLKQECTSTLQGGFVSL